MIPLTASISRRDEIFDRDSQITAVAFALNKNPFGVKVGLSLDPIQQRADVFHRAFAFHAVVEIEKRLYQIIAGKRDLTADTALRLARYFGTSPDFWMNLQAAYELDLARKKIGAAIKRIPQRKRRQPSEAQP